MKAYKNEPVPKSLVPLLAILAGTWIILAVVAIVLTGGLS